MGFLIFYVPKIADLLSNSGCIIYNFRKKVIIISSEGAEI